MITGVFDSGDDAVMSDGQFYTPKLSYPKSNQVILFDKLKWEKLASKLKN